MTRRTMTLLGNCVGVWVLAGCDAGSLSSFGGGDGNDNRIIEEPPTERLIPSYFDLSDEGWSAGGAEPVAEDGEVSSDLPGEWYWMAPAKFLGDRSAAFGQVLSFDWNVDPSCIGTTPSEGMVILKGDFDSLYWNESPGDVPVIGRGFNVTLNNTEAWHRVSTGAKATNAEIRTILSNLQGLEIFGHGADCQGSASLDSVELNQSSG